MNYKMMGRFISRILMVEAVFMVPAMLISLWEREFAVVRAFMWTLAAILVVVGVLVWACKGSKNKFYAKEGLACVGLSWLVMSLLGCLPFFLSGVMPNFVTGWEAWECWYFCWPYPPWEEARAAIPCICFVRKVPAPLWESLCQK